MKNKKKGYITTLTSLMIMKIAVRNFLLVTCYSFIFTRYSLLFTGYSLLSIRYSLLFTCYSLYFARYSLLFTYYFLLLTRYFLFVTFYFLLFTFYSLLIANCYPVLLTRYSLGFILGVLHYIRNVHIKLYVSS